MWVGRIGKVPDWESPAAGGRICESTQSTKVGDNSKHRLRALTVGGAAGTRDDEPGKDTCAPSTGHRTQIEEPSGKQRAAERARWHAM